MVILHVYFSLFKEPGFFLSDTEMQLYLETSFNNGR